MPTENIYIVVLSGSIRQGRQTHQLAVYLQKQLSSRPNVEATLIDLVENYLPLLDKNPDEYIQQKHPIVSAMAQWLQAADAVVWVSPEYHGSFSGVLKNALDYFWHEFDHKPIGIAAAASGKFGGINASTQMQHLALSIGGFAMPYKLIVPHIDRAFDEQNMPLDAGLNSNVNTFIDELLWLTEAIVRQKKATKNLF